MRSGYRISSIQGQQDLKLVQYVGKLTGERLFLRVGESDKGEGGDVFYLGGVDGHGDVSNHMG